MFINSILVCPNYVLRQNCKMDFPELQQEFETRKSFPSKLDMYFEAKFFSRKLPQQND